MRDELSVSPSGPSEMSANGERAGERHPAAARPRNRPQSGDISGGCLSHIDYCRWFVACQAFCLGVHLIFPSHHFQCMPSLDQEHKKGVLDIVCGYRCVNVLCL